MNLFKRALLSIFSLALATSIPRQAVAAPEICQSLGNYRYQNLRDNGPGRRQRGYVCFVVKDSRNLQGVLTLKHLDNRGDWDILVGTSFDPIKKKVYGSIDYQNNRGNIDEIVWLPSDSNREYVAVAFPASNTPSNACLIFHRFDTDEVVSNAMAQTIAIKVLESIFTSSNESQESRNAKSRVITLGLSTLQRKNLASVGYDLMLNEISTQLANTFGGGSWLFTYGVNYYGGYLEESGRFLFDRNMDCTE